jgi:ribokinase
MVGSVGDDEAGREQVRGLQEAGVDVSCIRTTGAPTGTAIVLVDQAGENQIVLSLGANACVDVEPRALVGADAVLTQLEIPLAAVEAAAALADGLFCLNAAPARDLPAALVARCDLIVVNEREQAAIHGLSEARLVAVTEGAAGATLRAYGHPVAHAAPPAVTAIDTVGAGDAFAAAITACLARGEAVEDALSFACAAGALATTRRGAQSALPTYEEVTACLQGAS